MISSIAAIGIKNELGKDNTLLFDIPEDMKYFRHTTAGHTVIMGRKTFESLPNGPLPGRKNIVITRENAYLRHGVDVVHSIEEAVEKVKNEKEAFVIGGAEIYKQAMPYVDKLYITHVKDTKEADAFFPAINPTEWEEEKRDPRGKFDFVVYKKKL